MRTIIERLGYDPKDEADNGNRFLTGNGYMGVRGTLCEAGPRQLAAVNLAGIHHQKGGGWEEPLNAPNPFYLRVEGASLPEQAEWLTGHRLALDIASGLFARESTFKIDDGALTLAQRRFCCMGDVHLAAQRVALRADRDTTLEIEYGIDGNVWDIHGPHYETIRFGREDAILTAEARTDDGQRVCVAARVTDPCFERELGYLRGCLALRANEETIIEVVAAIYTGKDCADPMEAALRAVEAAPGWDILLETQKKSWAALWDDARVEIDGDERAEFAVNYSLYHLMSIAPRHADGLSVPARGLSGQTYKGAVFWDTEMFMLDFYLACMPEVARRCLQYRVDSLPAALEKAAEYGLGGAFYAWESVEGGKDACSDYNVTDVFTGRPMRTYFRDRQVHISAAIVYGLKKYLERTGDESLMRAGGARVVLECARFYMSLISRRIVSGVYDINDVIGPDEYHEHVNNNAYTNEMARMTLRYAVEVCPKYLPDTPRLELDTFRNAAERLKVQVPDPETGVIEQFDGYFKLEDATVEAVRSRLKDPREYWGGAYGVAAQTQVIKQADVIALLYMLGGHPESVVAANYDYYEPRTEHGSSLSACTYALCACMIGRPDAAYPLFLKSAEADIAGGGKQWAGLVYIGGTHPAAAGGAYMVLLFGFLGLRFEGGKPVLHPRLPRGWRRVRLPLRHLGERYALEAES